MSSLRLFDSAGLSDDERRGFARAFGSFTTLEQVLDFGRAQDPPLVLDDVVTMDEYTHDVLMRLPNGCYLAFDTT